MTRSGVAGRGEVWGPPTARSVLFLLTALHGTLPFLSAAPLSSRRVAAASILLSAVYLYLALSSWTRPVRSFSTGFGLLSLVLLIGSITGASPVAQGAVFKFGALLALAFGAAVSRAAPQSES